jgi:hypothetical protein
LTKIGESVQNDILKPSYFIFFFDILFRFGVISDIAAEFENDFGFEAGL